MEIKTVSIIGLGGLGILFGNHLANRMEEQNLRFIADKSRIDKYRINGVCCNDKPCRFQYVEPDEQTGAADLAIFAVKYHDLKNAMVDMKNQIDEHTIILSLLNGITSEKVIGETYGMENIIYSVAQGMDAVKLDNQLFYNHMGMICFGDLDTKEPSEQVKALDNFFTKMELPHIADKDMKRRLWGKFMLNVGVNQTVAVYNGNYGTIQKDGEARDTMIAAMREVLVLSSYEGVPMTEEDLKYWLNVLNDLNPEGKPSLAQDVDAKRYTEVELFAGTMIRLGKKHGVTTPVNQMLYDKIKEIEGNY